MELWTWSRQTEPPGPRDGPPVKQWGRYTAIEQPCRADSRAASESLVISPATARTYVSRLLAKLEARDRAQHVVIAHRAGLVGGGD